MVALSSLTRVPGKADLYRRETYFREGLSEAEEAFGPNFAEVLEHSALIMLKPDGLAAAKLGAVVGYLGQHDFTIVGVQRLTFTGHMWRELWRYQLTSATLDRLAVNENLLTAGSALLLVLRSEAGYGVPATVRLSGLKGSATPSAQRPGTLRSLLDQPNRVFSFVHVADEPADLLREFGLLLDPPTRRRLLAALAGGVLSPSDRDVLDDALHRDAEGGLDLSSAAAVRRVSHVVREHPEGGRALALLELMDHGERIEWRPFLRELNRLGLEVDRWDLAILGTSFIVYDEPGARKVLENPLEEVWLPESAHVSD